MVATKLSEVAGKGWGLYATASTSSSSSNENKKEIERRTTPPSSLAKASALSSSSWLSLQKAAESAYSGISNVYSSLYVPSLGISLGRSGGIGSDGSNTTVSKSVKTAAGIIDEDGLSASSIVSGLTSGNNTIVAGRNNHHHRRRTSILSPSLQKILHNPYIGVRGGGRIHKAKPPNESMDAVRKLLELVDTGDQSSVASESVVGSGLPLSERRPSSHPENSNEKNTGNDEEESPLPPSSPSQTPLKATERGTAIPSISSSGSVTETPRHRNTAVESFAWNYNAENDDGFVARELSRQTYLPQQLPTIDSVSIGNDQSIEPEQDHNLSQSNKNKNTLHNSNNDNALVDRRAPSSSYSLEETASQLTEGTLRALRDLALDEALELHASLKYWSDRWERPVFSWFIAGPLVWFGWIQNNNNNNEHWTAATTTMNGNRTRKQAKMGRGYDHTVMVGQRVSQIQSVLARRLSAIGELQHHLLRAGWQRGVAHWGFLGEGGNWAAVDGTDGRMMDDEDSSQNSFDERDSGSEGDDDDDEGDGGDDDDDDDNNDGDHHHHNHKDFGGEEMEGGGHHDENDRCDGERDGSELPLFDKTPRLNLLATHQADVHHHHQQQSSLSHQNQQHGNHRYRLLRREYSEASVGSIGLHIDVPPPPATTTTGLATPRSKMASDTRFWQHGEQREQVGSLYYTNLRVLKHKRKGEWHIQKDDQALCEWSIDALALVRSQLIRASNGKIALPHSENWPFEQVTASVTEADVDKSNPNGLPSWAGIRYVSSSSSSSSRTARTRMESGTSCCFSITEETGHPTGGGTPANGAVNDAYFPKIGTDFFEHTEEETTATRNFKGPKRRSPSQKSIASIKERAVVGISNLPLMMDEVSSLLDVMEDIMDIQKARRLEKLKPPPWWRQHWFLVAMVPPSLGYLLYKNLIGRGQTWKFAKYATEKLLDFAREHVVLPCVALYDELTKGPDSISDHAARDTAIEILKKMIRSWLDETHPEMLEAEKVRLSDAMDVTLIEETKEQAMKSVYNMNSVIRMSFIEAQFIKKEMMNALVALDEMQASTNFNMNLAAITPFVLLIWTINKISRFIFYTTFKWGKSRLETYRSFLDALTEIERLLIMRSDPPAPPTIPRHDSTQTGQGRSRLINNTPAYRDCVLESDDLGMLMLHIHELRTILWQERRRFSPNALRSVSEDLAELSGERGAVSVRQQLLIVERMNRAYSFLKQGAID